MLKNEKKGRKEGWERGKGFFCGQVGKSVLLLTFSKKSSIMCLCDSGASFRWRGKNKLKETPLQKKGSEEPIGNAGSESLFHIFWTVFSARFFFASQVGTFVWC